MTITVYYDQNFYGYYGSTSNAVAAIQRILAQAEAIFAWSELYQTIYFKKLNHWFNVGFLNYKMVQLFGMKSI